MALIVLFPEPELRGPALVIDSPVPILNISSPDFDHVKSAHVIEGTWHLFQGVEFQFPVFTVDPLGGSTGNGVYRNHDEWGKHGDMIVSLRPYTPDGK